ncbi:MAG TPA: DUF29 family protein [Acidisphaera sp.]|nr:DUF29 family protein [Acidisphaera sp.]
MPDGLYDRDILIWSEQQADLLHRLAAGDDRVVGLIDWENVIHEIECVGRRELNEFYSSLLTALVLILSGTRRMRSDWWDKVCAALCDAEDRQSPSIRERTDLEDIYRGARQVVAAGDPDYARSLPEACPFTLDELLADPFDVLALVTKVDEAAAARNA